MTTPLDEGPLAAESESTESQPYEIPTECKALVPADAQNLLATIHGRLDMLNRYATDVIIQDPEAAKNASTKLAVLTQSAKQLKEKRLSLTRPIDAQKTLISLPFNDLQNRIEPIKLVLGQKVIRYQDEVDAKERARQEEERRRAAEVLEKERAEIQEQADLNKSEYAQQEAEDIQEQIEELQQAPAVIPAARTSTLAGTVGRQKRWTYKVVDLKKIPRKYLAVVIDQGPKRGQLDSGHKLVVAEIAAGKREIKGLEIYQKSHVAIR